MSDWARTWTIAGTADECGYDGARIPPGEPMQLLGPASWYAYQRLRRCVVHAYGPIDQAAVDAAREAVAAELRERQAREAELLAACITPPVVAAPRSHRRRRRSDGFAKVSDIGGPRFDPKAAAAGRYD